MHQIIFLFAFMVGSVTAQANVIFLLIRDGQLAYLQALLKDHPTDVNIRFSDNKTPLIWAAWDSKLNIVEELLSVEGVEVDAKDKAGYTALALACTQKHDDQMAIVERLLQANSDVNTQTVQGRTPLDFAIEYNHELIPLLLAKGARYEHLMEKARAAGVTAYSPMTEHHRQVREALFPLCPACHVTFSPECPHGVTLSFDSVVDALVYYQSRHVSAQSRVVQNIIKQHYQMMSVGTIAEYKTLLEFYKNDDEKDWFANRNVDKKIMRAYFFEATKFYCGNTAQ